MNLKEILKKHEAWLKGEPGGERANLMGADLRDANLMRAILTDAILMRADLTSANLWGADLRHSDLWGANLMHADLTGANLWRADLRHSDLWGAYLRAADLEGANLTGAILMRADLTSANLWGADLTGANLQGSCLWNTIGNGKEIKSAQFEIWNITWTHDRLQIGCENHAIEEWWEFTDEQISEMDPYALEWWRQNKDLIMHLVKSQPCN